MGKQRIRKRLISILLLCCLLCQTVFMLTGCNTKPNVRTKVEKPEKITTLNVYDSLSSYYGVQKGWMAQYLKDKFNVKLNIITGMELSNKEKKNEIKNADIIIFRDIDNEYKDAVKDGILYDWNQNELLAEHGEYIQEHMEDALKANQACNDKILAATGSAIYGIGNDVAWSDKDHQEFTYSWDVRWDLYQKLDSPDIENLQDYSKMLKDLNELNISETEDEKDNDGKEKTYAVSVWSDWDDEAGMVNCVKDMVSAYYGYEAAGLGFYDSVNDKYIGLFDEDSPYLEMMQYFNDLYRNGLLDPASKNQKYDDVVNKVKAGNVLTSLNSYTGSDIYNTQERISDDNMMLSLKPDDAKPLVYGINKNGNGQITAIGGSTKYPELCMDILDYFVTPEGRMTMSYGPRAVTWDYDENGNIHFTEFGKKCQEDEKTSLEEPFTGSYIDGTLKAALSSWSIDAENPDSNSETYNKDKWGANIENPSCALEQEWRDYNNCDNREKYFEKKGCVVVQDYCDVIEIPELYEKKWAEISKKIISETWEAIYSDSDNEYNRVVDNMIKEAHKNSYDRCVWWWRGKMAAMKTQD